MSESQHVDVSHELVLWGCERGVPVVAGATSISPAQFRSRSCLDLDAICFLVFFQLILWAIASAMDLRIVQQIGNAPRTTAVEATPAAPAAATLQSAMPPRGPVSPEPEHRAVQSQSAPVRPTPYRVVSSPRRRDPRPPHRRMYHIRASLPSWEVPRSCPASVPLARTVPHRPHPPHPRCMRHRRNTWSQHLVEAPCRLIRCVPSAKTAIEMSVQTGIWSIYLASFPLMIRPGDRARRPPYRRSTSEPFLPAREDMPTREMCLEWQADGRFKEITHQHISTVTLRRGLRRRPGVRWRLGARIPSIPVRRPMGCPFNGAFPCLNRLVRQAKVAAKDTLPCHA